MSYKKLPSDSPCANCDRKEPCECADVGKNCPEWREWFARAWQEVVKPFKEIGEEGGMYDDY